MCVSDLGQVFCPGICVEAIEKGRAAEEAALPER